MELVLVAVAIAYVIVDVKESFRLIKENNMLSKKYNDLRVENARLKSKAGK